MEVKNRPQHFAAPESLSPASAGTTDFGPCYSELEHGQLKDRVYDDNSEKQHRK